ncbi:hypothetical protein [Pararhizobium arenae]|uniref:hypothetical protein n=1 Tax=Pararhizobium arenae TaxID=1856850 RepID=UPI00094B2AA3|nr:hypothetical protein [Pararhizobium arenae]
MQGLKDSYLDNIFANRPVGDFAYRYIDELAKDVRGFIEHVSKQEPAVRIKPMDDFNLEVWITTGHVQLLDGDNKRRDDDHPLSLVYGSAMCDVAASMEDDPLIIAFMALIDIAEHTTFSRGLRKLIAKAETLISSDIAARALQRHTPVDVELKLARDMVANDNDELDFLF